MLSEFQLHGAPVPKARIRTYTIPSGFKETTEKFLAYRRFEGIVERNMSTVSLYLERFFSYLTGQNVKSISEINIQHIHGFLRYITAFSNQTKAHTMCTVRKFMGYCFKNGYSSVDLSASVPYVHYEKRSRLPSTYSYDDVLKLISLIDRSNPIGKRDYAVFMLLTRLGIRCGDICELKFENIDWDRNLISFTQHKTGKPITLPLFEDVGLAIIEYLKFGRPKCESTHIFVRHHAPLIPFISRSLYTMVSGYISKAGLLTEARKHGPHALRHSLAGRLLEENVPLPVISEILGHTNSNTTAAYLSISIEQLRRCALEV
jgi:site-specific recombinase XerD